MVDNKSLKIALDKLGYSSYDEIVEEYQHKVYSTVYSLTQNVHDAQDLSQEVFWLIYQNLPSFKHDSKLSTWIYKIAVNICMMYRRKEARRRSIAKIVPINTELNNQLRDSASVDMDVIRSEDKDILYKALDAISQKYAAVITLKYIQDLSVKEIGQILNLPKRTVETQIYRAKDKLRNSLSNLGYSTEENNHGL